MIEAFGTDLPVPKAFCFVFAGSKSAEAGFMPEKFRSYNSLTDLGNAGNRTVTQADELLEGGDRR